MADEPKVPSGWVDQSWNGDASQWADAASYCGACLIDMNPSGQDKKKELCHLPYKEPSGKINVQGVLAAAGGRGITRVSAPASVKRAAAKKLMQMYGMMGRTAPDMLKRMAG